ncbi:hypothetical protein R1sor_001384 [Riccia sorocarpa]|uniref:Uncharacterized protein n=1 Tax=Riccia sorocarpa TaxID=122646 RepID=A0ABD3GYW2_9MARC
MAGKNPGPQRPDNILPLKHVDCTRVCFLKHRNHAQHLHLAFAFEENAVKTGRPLLDLNVKMGSVLSSKLETDALPTDQLQEVAVKEKKRKRGSYGYELLSKSESQSASARKSAAFQTPPEDTGSRSVFSKRRRHGENRYSLLDVSSSCEGDTCKNIDDKFTVGQWSGRERTNPKPDDQSRPISKPGLWFKQNGRVKLGGSTSQDVTARRKATLLPVSFNVAQPSILSKGDIITTGRTGKTYKQL